MGVLVRRTLLWLPIHKRSQDRYQLLRSKVNLEKQRRLERIWSMPYSEVPRDVRAAGEEHGMMGPWMLNDVIGALELGHDGGRCLAGDIYIRAKYLPKESPLRRANTWTPTQSARMFYYESTDREELASEDAAEYGRAAFCVVKSARRVARSRVRTAEVWMPAYGLAVLDLAAADKKLRDLSA